MKMVNWRALAGALICSAAACLPAQATSLNFEDVDPTLFSGSSITTRGFELASGGQGFSGVDDPAAFLMANAPANANSRFAFALNSDNLTLSHESGNGFYLFGFDAAFIAPFGGIGPDIDAGELHLTATTSNGNVINESFWFGLSDASGNWNFLSFTTQALNGLQLASVEFSACVYDANSCVFGLNQNVLPQFALDNLSLSVPEPASLVLTLAGLGLAGVSLRRRTV
jgi:hypothetical protein